jgi:uncharacterized protein (DUF1499 family)
MTASATLEPGAATPGRARARRIAARAVRVTFFAILLLLITGPGYRIGILPVLAALLLFLLAGFAAGTAGLVSLIGLWPAVKEGRRRDAVLIAVAFLAGAVAFAMPARQLRMGSSVPPIHDITTDTENPPEFVAVVPLRAGAANPVAYEGEKVAEQQRKGYPDLKPVILPLPPAQVMQRSLDAAKALGWHIVAYDEAAGRLEATDTTAWMGFKDDVVIRVVPEGDGSRLDIRSLSRVGQGDVGKNAQRIRAFLARLQP